jgi:hypothetical protein
MNNTEKAFSLGPKLLIHKKKKPRMLSELAASSNPHFEIVEFFGTCVKMDSKATVRETIRKSHRESI